MINAYFGDIANGRLQRLPYLGYSVFLIALLFGFVFGSIILLGTAENIMGGDLASAQNMLMETLGIPYTIILGIMVFVVIAGLLNLMAKRVRDIGLPGWLLVLGLVIVSALISRYVSNSASNSFSSIVGIGLLLIPSDTFGGNRK